MISPFNHPREFPVARRLTDFTGTVVLVVSALTTTMTKTESYGTFDNFQPFDDFHVSGPVDDHGNIQQRYADDMSHNDLASDSDIQRHP